LGLGVTKNLMWKQEVIMMANTALGAKKKEVTRTIIFKDRNIKISIMNICKNAGIRMYITKHWFTAWDYQKIPE